MINPGASAHRQMTDCLRTNNSGTYTLGLTESDIAGQAADWLARYPDLRRSDWVGFAGYWTLAPDIGVLGNGRSQITRCLEFFAGRVEELPHAYHLRAAGRGIESVGPVREPEAIYRDMGYSRGNPGGLR
jgi:hypothetical protein